RAFARKYAPERRNKKLLRPGTLRKTHRHPHSGCQMVYMKLRQSMKINYKKAERIYSRPGKPADNCFAEAFNRILRMECLEANYFPDMTNAGKVIEEWTDDYNRNRPQKGLKGLTPEQFKSKLLSAKPNLNSGRTLG
nr:integrase core domain-containing protein [Elusimicrobiales bacterium]